jgi:glycosyltransferase involved in cell wall biosynthesis
MADPFARLWPGRQCTILALDPESADYTADYPSRIKPANRGQRVKLSILMPAYNEAATVGIAVKRVLDIHYPCDVEVVVVDDGSVDNTGEVLATLDDPRVVVTGHAANRGKGAAVRTAASLATGDYLLVFDADLEYSADDILGLLAPVSRGDAEVVYGVRKFGASTAHSFWFVIGNRVNTFTANALFNTWISDLHTCLKLLPASLFRELPLSENRFGLDTELTALLLARGVRPYEVPITYKARSREEGKKLTWGDGVVATKILLRVRVIKAITDRRARIRGAMAHR